MHALAFFTTRVAKLRAPKRAMLSHMDVGYTPYIPPTPIALDPTSSYFLLMMGCPLVMFLGRILS